MTIAVERLHVLFSPDWCRSLSKPRQISVNQGELSFKTLILNEAEFLSLQFSRPIIVVVKVRLMAH
jgi:hypothetical protein